MKKIFFKILLISILLFTGCSNSGKNNIVDKLNKKIKNMDSYDISGVLSITNNNDTYNYDVRASYKKDNNYRVSLVNKSNGHEQIILKSDGEVYVITPALNKSFKFQSSWPDNNSQIIYFGFHNERYK